jgi:plastocyanin
MKKNLIGTLLLFFIVPILLFRCSKNYDGDNNSGGGGGNNSNFIYMKNSVFSTANLTITVGGTVTWMNDDNMIHTVTADDGSYNSGNIQVNGSFNKTFNATGVYSYHCVYHSGMTGRITVVTR